MSCQCRDAVLRAYEKLTEAGQRDDRAYDAAVQVFRYYHPDRPKVQAYEVVADWLDQGQQQAVALRSTFSGGLDALGATENPGEVPDGQFFAWLGQAQWVRRIDP